MNIETSPPYLNPVLKRGMIELSPASNLNMKIYKTCIKVANLYA